VTAEKLAAKRARLSIGKIDDRGWVYVNGRLAGESHDWNNSPAFEIRKGTFIPIYPKKSKNIIKF
jgi:hypothetical protein